MLAIAQHAALLLPQVIDYRVDIFCTLANITSLFKRIGLLEKRQSATPTPLLTMDRQLIHC
jgi:hypothetical protein